MKIKESLFFISIVFFCWDLPGQIGMLKVGEPFELKAFTTMEGKQISLDSVENKVLVMNFWSIGCTGCEKERPYLNDLYQEYKNQDIIFLSITNTSNEILASHLREHPVDWDVIEGIDFLGLKGDQTFLVKCMPTTIVVDKKGYVDYSACSLILEGRSGNDFMKLLDEALAE